jgi:hypothetical protein
MELQHFKAFIGAAVDARLHGRAKAIAGNPSAGDAPRVPATLDTNPPATASVVAR